MTKEKLSDAITSNQRIAFGKIVNYFRIRQENRNFDILLGILTEYTETLIPLIGKSVIEDIKEGLAK